MYKYLHKGLSVLLVAVLNTNVPTLLLCCRHFDKDKSGRLDTHEFKSCLRALGNDLPMVEEGQVDPEFDAILDIVDPNRYGELDGNFDNDNENSLF